MKSLYFTIILTGICACLNAQDFSKLKDINLKDSSACRKAEPKAMECANYLLSKPCVEDLNSLECAKFLIDWMGQTPDYSFVLATKVEASIKSDMMLQARYIASEVSVALGKKIKTDDPDFELQFTKMFLNYCERPENKVKLSSKLKKLIEAKNNGTLKDAIKEK